MTHPKYPSEKRYNSNFRYRPIIRSQINALKNYFLKLIQDEFFKVQKTIQIDDTNRPKIAKCFDWVIGDVDVALGKGLLLRGNVGTGKSCIMKAVKSFVNELYPNIFTLYLTSDQIANIYKLTGEEFDKRLNQVNTCKILFIDDIGYEPLKVFENSPIAEVIRERYDKRRITCLTTNFEMSELALRYGTSFEDKLSEMCYIIKFEGESKR